MANTHTALRNIATINQKYIILLKSNKGKLNIEIL